MFEEEVGKCVEELEKEIIILRHLKDKKKFSLQQSEYSLKRLSEKIINIFVNP